MYRICLNFISIQVKSGCNVYLCAFLISIVLGLTELNMGHDVQTNAGEQWLLAAMFSFLLRGEEKQPIEFQLTRRGLHTPSAVLSAENSGHSQRFRTKTKKKC